VTIDCTCTPYQIYQGPTSLAGRGDHLAWGESSAIFYANSVIGARTNREGGPSALAAALADILIAEAVRDLDIAPGEGHPFYRLV
jgi:predicted aconitase